MLKCYYHKAISNWSKGYVFFVKFNIRTQDLEVSNVKVFLLKRLYLCNSRSGDRRKGVNLSLISKTNDETANRERRLIGERVIDGFRSHVTREHTAIGGETSDGDTDVVVYFEDLPLVRRELRLGFIDGGEDDMGARSEPDGGGALLDCFHGVLHLEETACWAPCRHICVVLIPEHFSFLLLPWCSSLEKGL